MATAYGDERTCLSLLLADNQCVVADEDLAVEVAPAPEAQGDASVDKGAREAD